MRPSRFLLVVLSIAVFVTFAAACAGGGGGIAPCCEATGSTDQPTQGPAMTLADIPAGHLTAQPIVFDGAACVTLQGDRPNLTGFHTVGKADDVGLLGRYNVKIDKSAEGQQVYVLISDSAGARAIGFVPADEASSSVGTYHVAPIHGSPSANHVGESTLESAYWCYVLTNNPSEAQAAGAASIRAAIGPEIDDIFPVDTGLPALEPYITAGSKPADAMVAFAPALKPAIRLTFDIAERMVDTCRDGNDPLNGTPGISCKLTDPDHDRLAEFYRGWAIAHVGPLSGLTFGPGVAAVMVTVADQVNKNLPVGGAPGLGSSVALRAEMFRLEGEAAGIEAEATALALPSANIAKFQSDIAGQRVAILQTSGVVAAKALALASTLLDDLSANTAFGVDTSCSKVAIANAMQNNVSNTETSLTNASTTQQILDAYLTGPVGTGTLLDQADTQLQSCASLSNQVERKHWATIVVYATLSTVTR